MIFTFSELKEMFGRMAPEASLVPGPFNGLWILGFERAFLLAKVTKEGKYHVLYMERR